MKFDIFNVQKRLAELGFDPGPVDGVRGPKTDAALVRFKQSVGLRARPYLGPLTYEALFAEPVGGGIPWLNETRAVMGLHERRDTPRLRRWFDKSVSWIDPRDVPWCGAFVATVMRRWNPAIALPSNPLGAQSWLEFGESCTPQLGAVMVFWRVSPDSWKGHVGLYWYEDDDCYHILGGNQSNAVTVARVSKYRLKGARWPAGQEHSNKRILLNRKGAPVSRDEA